MSNNEHYKSLLNRITNLETGMRRTRVGVALSLATIGIGTLLGLKYLGKVHHDVYWRKLDTDQLPKTCQEKSKSDV